MRREGKVLLEDVPCPYETFAVSLRLFIAPLSAGTPNLPGWAFLFKFPSESLQRPFERFAEHPVVAIRDFIKSVASAHGDFRVQLNVASGAVPPLLPLIRNLHWFPALKLSALRRLPGRLPGGGCSAFAGLWGVNCDRSRSSSNNPARSAMDCYPLLCGLNHMDEFSCIFARISDSVFEPANLAGIKSFKRPAE